MKKIANSNDLTNYYSQINKYIDDYIKSHKVSPREIFRYISKNMSKFLKKYNLEDIDNIQRIVKDVIEHRKNMEKDKVFKFEQFNHNINESLFDLGETSVEHEKILADYYNTSLGHIHNVDSSNHLYKIEDFGDSIESIIFSDSEISSIKEVIINKITNELKHKTVLVNSIDSVLLTNPMNFLLENILSEEKLRENCESKLTELTLLEMITILIPSFMGGQQVTQNFKFKGNFKGYYIWDQK